jgi:cobalt transporter subunit CbtA
MFQRILLASIVAGVVAGIALTALQSGAVTPLVLAAETYETAGGDPALLPHRHRDTTHTHASGDLAHEHDGHALLLGDPGTAPDGNRAAADAAATGPGHGDSAHRQTHGHGHDHGDAWAPGDGIERTFWTAVSNVAAAIGFALLLVAVFAWRGGATWWQGLLGGAAGFFVFFVNPAIGLHPEIPGAFAAALFDRQLWWLFAVGCSVAGVGLLLLAPRAAAKAGGAVLLVVPHLAGAPHPEVSGGLAPDGLADAFVVAAAATNAAFWLVLGVVAAVAFGRLSRS